MTLEPMRQGDTVDVVAPASRCTDEELKSAVAALSKLGLHVRVPTDLFGPTKLFANTDERRLAQLKKALFARDSKLVWCVRGGYGSIRLMEQVRRWRPPPPKIFIGFSDITTLHAHLNQHWGWPTLHGPLLDRLGRGEMSAKEKKQLLDMIFGQALETRFDLRPLNALAKKKSLIRGPVLGGNLAVLQSGLGTPSGFAPGRHILFLEDRGERPHRVDRMLCQMSQAGQFRRVLAVVFGYFQLQQGADQREIWQDVIARFSREAKFPVYRGLPVGHDHRVQFTLPFNTPSQLRGGANPSLTVTSGIGAR